MRPMRPFKSIRVQKLRIPTPHGGIPALLLSPVDAPSNATGVLWLHGGGYAVGMKEMPPAQPIWCGTSARSCSRRDTGCHRWLPTLPRSTIALPHSSI